MLHAALIAIGLAAGALTTVAGVGGALVALAATSLLLPARVALAVTAAALLVGSLHRAWVYRRQVAWPLTARMGVGLVAGALLGAALVPRLPEAALRGALIAVAAVAVASAWSGRTLPLSPRLAVSSGLAIGAIGASAGGAALLIAPVLQAAGLRGERYAGSGAVCAAIFNASRCAGYLVAGLYAGAPPDATALLAAACVAGNFTGVGLRRWMGPRAVHAVELGAPLAAIALALAGG
jgi:uncharacterized membrane protein YfcA